MEPRLEFEELQRSDEDPTEVVFCHVPTRAYFYRNFLLPTLGKVSRHTATFQDREFEQPQVSEDFAQRFPEAADIYKAVISKNEPNYRGARILLPTELKLQGKLSFGL